MRLEENLRTNPLFASEEWEERFRRALDCEVERGRDFSGNFRKVLVSEIDPESIAAVLASIISRVPVLLASGTWGQWTLGALARNREFPVADGSVLIRTGGSSGEPKFAIHSWNSLETAALNLWEHLGRKPLSAELDLPLHHVSGWMPVMRALVSGGQIVSGGSRAVHLPGLFLSSVVPTTLYRALQNPQQLNHLRRAARIFAGGAAFPDDLLRRAREEGLPLSLVYGLTETAAMVAVQDPADFREGQSQRVKPLAENRISIRSQQEIEIESDQLFAGYLGQPPREEGLWATGDRGEIDDSGRLSILGRKGRFMASGGETVSLEKVERIAGELPRVSGSYALSVSDPEWGNRMILFLAVEGRPERDWRGELKSILDPAEVPAEIRVVKEIPRNGAGKVDPDRLFG